MLSPPKPRLVSSYDPLMKTLDPVPRAEAESRSEQGPGPALHGRPARPPRALYYGLPAAEGSFAEDLLLALMKSQPLIEIVAVTTPEPGVFHGRKDLAGIELIQKDDFEFSDRIEKLAGRHSFCLSRDLLEKHAASEYSYLSISDRRGLSGLPVFKRRRAYRQLLAFWYDFLSSRKIDVVLSLGYPHAGWNNVLVDVARALGVKVVMLDFTVISQTTLVGEMDRLYERVPAERYARLTLEELRASIPAELRERLAAELYGLDFSSKVKQEVLGGQSLVSRLRDVARLLPKPWRRRGRSVSRIAGAQSPFFESLISFQAKRHVAGLAAYYDSVSKTPPDLDKPFIYFPLHMQPERSTTPAGGFFEDQLLVAEILAASLPEGWSLYIKEHPSQFWQARAPKQAWFRDRAYYERIMALPNTRLVALDYDSRKLIRKAAVVATITGTAGWESLLGNKACLAFGKPWYVGCRACFEIDSVEACKAAIAAALAMPKKDVERAVVEFLLHYSDRIIPVPYLPDPTLLSREDYERATATIVGAIHRAIVDTASRSSSGQSVSAQ